MKSVYLGAVYMLIYDLLKNRELLPALKKVKNMIGLAITLYESVSLQDCCSAMSPVNGSLNFSP